MLSLDLFDSKYERELREGAVDDLEYRRMNDLREKMEYLMQAYRQADTDEVRNAIMKRYNEYKTERESYMKVREQQVPSKQDPFAYVKPEPRGIGDVQDPKAKMAQLAQRSKKGPLANVAAGVKAFVKGEPEPIGEEQQAINPRALGVANFQRLVKANMGAYPSVSLEFIRPEENFKLDQRGLDLISDYYDGLENDQAKNYFIYRVLPSGEETLKVLKQLGYSPVQAQQQQNLPGIPTQGELPLQEKKKSNNDDLEAGDIKVARELQKLRAEYPAARSDVEAVARAEIDSTERSQRQLSAIRGANEKQDALLKQLVALDQEQGREINTLDKENNSLEQRLAQVQATNDRLQQALGKMTGTKKAATKTTATTVPPTGTVDIAQGGIIDVDTPVATPADQPKEKPTQTTSPALGSMAQQLGGFSKVIPMRSVRPTQPTTDTEPESQPAPSIRQKKVSGSDIEEHGGGIGPRQHWQSMMPEGQPQELINRYLAINAETDVDAVRKAIQAISRDPALGANSKARLLGQIGMIIQRHRLPIGRSYYQFMQQYMEAVELDRARVPGYPQDPATAKHRLDTAKAILSDPRSDVDSRREAASIVAKSDNPGVNETVENVRAGMARIYRKLAPKIERHRDSFLAGQLYDELENYAELHGAEGEFKRMMSTARNRAHMEYDTNPGGFQNWFWFLPFEDHMEEGWSDQGNPTPYSVYIDGREWRAYKSDDHARAVAEKVRVNLKKQGRDQTVTIAPSKAKRVQEDFGMPGTTIPRKSVIQGYTVFFNPKTQVVSVTRGGDSEEAAIEQARVGTPSMKNFRQAADRLIDKIESDLTENLTREPRTARERDDMIDKIRRMMTQDRNPANLQIMKKDIEILQTKYRDLKEDSGSGEAVEMAIMRRMLIAHTDLIVEFGLDKVVDAIEEVAYNVGDTDEIGSSDVSGWVRQVKQILGVDA
jgi:hypothetical protein